MAHQVERTGLRSERKVIDENVAGDPSWPPPANGAPRALPSLPEILAVMAISLTIAVLLVSSLLNYAYERFYQALGVRPGEVGLTFGVALSRSAGFMVVLAIVGTLVAVAVRGLLAGPRRRLGAQPDRIRRFQSRDFAIVLGGYVTLGLLTVYAAAAVTSSVTSYTAKSADTARSGNSVRPLRLYGLPLLAIQADSATLQPTNKARTLPGIWDLHDRSVLYLGQTGGTGVLYDAGRGRVIYTPMSSLVLHVHTCAGGPPEPDGCRPTRTSPST